MDKLLIEFADKAGFYVEGDKVFCDSFNSIHELLENYAELVIQECIEVADKSQYSCRTFPVSTSIVQHFGME